MDDNNNRNLVTAATVLGVSVVVSAIVVAGASWFLVDRSVGRIESAMDRATVRAAESAEALRVTVGGGIDNIHKAITPVYVQVGTPEPLKVRGVLEDGSIPVDVDLGKDK